MKADYVSQRGSSCGRSAAAAVPPSVSISLNGPAAAVVVREKGAGLRVTTGSGSQNKGSGFSQMGVTESSSYERGAPGAAAAVVAVGVAARQVGRGHQRVALVGAAVLSQRVHALLTVGLPSVRHRTVAVGVPRHQIHAVLRERERDRPIRELHRCKLNNRTSINSVPDILFLSLNVFK